MATYTVELGSLIKSGFRPALDAYPIYDEAHRAELNQKIIERYWYREIGQETPDRFNHFLHRKMNEIMPYYNQIYLSEAVQYDPLATEVYSRSVQEDIAKETETTVKERRKSGETVGDVYTENKDDKSQSQGSGTSDETRHDEHKGSSSENASYSKNGTDDITRVETKNQTETEDISSTSTVTNNLQTKTSNSTEGSGTNDTSGGKLSANSDVPQSSLSISAAIDGTGTSRQSLTGYASTAVNEATAQRDRTTTEESSSGTASNTGTVKTDGSSDRSTDSDTKTNGTDTRKWTETGSSEGSGQNDGSEDGTTGVKTTNEATASANAKTDSERNTSRNIDTGSRREDEQRHLENVVNQETSTGRKGFVPAELIMAYRRAITNVDLLILDELEPLFMGVY